MNVRADVGEGGVEDCRIGSLRIAADEHGASAAVAGGVYTSLAEQPYALPEQFHCAALPSCRGIGNIDRRIVQQSPVRACVEYDTAAPALQGPINLDRAAVNRQVPAVQVVSVQRDRIAGSRVDRKVQRRAGSNVFDSNRVGRPADVAAGIDRQRIRRRWNSSRAV